MESPQEVTMSKSSLDSDFSVPAVTQDIEKAARAVDFTISSDVPTGLLLRTLAASKPGGKLLELGTGCGMGTTWLLDGMDATAKLTTVDKNAHFSAIAQRFLSGDPRVTFFIGDGVTFIEAQQPASFDFIFADTWPGKFHHLDETLALLKPGGIYVIDDLLTPGVPVEEHAARVENLIATLEQRNDLHITKLNWFTGLIIAVKRAHS
jgi:predicted O-methyltransferase YrrM